MARASTRAERRDEVARLLVNDHEQSDRAVSRTTGVSHSTVAAVRASLELAGQIDRRPDQSGVAKQAESGPAANLRRQTAGEPSPATRHGGYSEARKRPLEDEHRARLQAEFPRVCSQPGGDDLINTACARLAMLDLMAAFVGQAGPIGVRGGRPEVSAPARELRLLLAQHEDAIARLQELEGDASSSDAYEQYRQIARGAGS